MSIKNLTLVHFRHFSSLLTNEYPVSRAQKNLFMQNKPNFPNTQMPVSYVLTMDYVNIRLRSRFKNKAKQTQLKPISERPKWT